MKKKIKSFKDAVRFLDSIPYINRGGCAISAVSLFLWLKKNGYNTQQTKIVYFYRHSSTYRTNQMFLSNKSKGASSCEHAVLYHKGCFIDSRGVIDKNTNSHPRISDYKLSHYIDFDVQFFMSSFKSSNWNDDFMRVKHVPIIEETLDIDLRSFVEL